VNANATRGLGRAATAAVLSALLLLLLGAALGSSGLDALWALPHDVVARRIVWDVRLPRTLGAWCAGALLGLAGVLAQGLFRNPLADPYLLGSASGAALGVALALALWGVAPDNALGLLRLGLNGAAFLGAVLGVLLTLLLARAAPQGLRLLLAGVVVGVVLLALKDIVTLLAPQVLQALQGFMLGGTAWVGWGGCAWMALAWVACLLLAGALSPVLDGLRLGEATTLSLGLPLARARVGLVLVLALATGVAVAQTGLIGFVGLAAPHLARALAKTSHAGLALLSSLLGGVLLMVADVLARALLPPQELPVGLLTAVLGGGYLLWLMHRRTPWGEGQ